MDRTGTLYGALLGALLLLTGPATSAPGNAAPPSSGQGIAVSGTRAFSPDGDGVKDVARIRYALDRAGDVTVEVRRQYDPRKLLLRRDLGSHRAGRHAWTWDGTLFGDTKAADASYVVRVLSRGATGEVRVDVDRRFRVSVGADPAYGARRADPVVVYPRSTAVRDTVGLRAIALERGVTRARLLVRAPDGRVVAETPVVRTGDEVVEARLTWAGRRSGRPLPPGRYPVEVRGTDRAGNRATSRPLAVLVSRHVLEWREETRIVQPAATVTGPCARSTANGCGDVSHCGTVVPSALFVGGLSLRSATCSDHPTGIINLPGAVSLHLVTVPEAVRGIDSYRVGFTGTPTRAGEDDPLTLTAGDSTLTSSSGARTPWLTSGPYLDGDTGGMGIPPLRPSVWWKAETAGDDSFDVASFTLDLRYLAVAP
jgi:hypothetical protein